MKKNGFVLAEFVIALPLLILLLYTLSNLTFKIFDYAKNQAAEFVLQNEVQTVLEQITSDAKAAHSVKIKKAVGDIEVQEIFFNFHAVGNEVNKKNFPPKIDFNSNSPEIIDYVVTHRFTAARTQESGVKIYAEREKSGQKVNPITGGNFFGDTSVTKLKFTVPSEKVLHIELEMLNYANEKKIKVSTSVFMPACEKVEIKS